MGGSGGGSVFGDKSPSERASQQRTAEQKTIRESFETEASALVASVLSQTHRDEAACQARLDQIKGALSEAIDGSIDLRFGGSVAKHTYVDGLSDVDTLLLLKIDADESDPAKVRQDIAKILRSDLDGATIRVGDMCVTVEFEDFEIQLLPAIKHGTHHLIPDSSSRGWAKIQPEVFANQLTKINTALNGRVVPVIKLAKSIISQLPKARQLTGYHVESLAVQIFDSYDGKRTSKAMLMYFFENAATRILTTISDPTGQSEYVDEHLAGPGSLERRLVADSLSRISRRMKNADAGELLDEWKRILDE